MLFHFSEEADIEIFIPREKQNRPEFPAVVWAIDGEHEFSYYFPRDCPRIICRRTKDISEKNNELFFNNTLADIIVTVESDWYVRIVQQTLYKYQFEDEGFEVFDKTAGYYISYQTVKPMGIEKIDRLVERLLSKGIELRFTPNLCPLRESIISSDFKGYGIHRFNNAKKL